MLPTLALLSKPATTSDIIDERVIEIAECTERKMYIYIYIA